MTAPAQTQADASAGALLRPLLPLSLGMTIVGLVGAFVGPFLPLYLSQHLHSTPAQTSTFLLLTQLSGIAVASLVGHFSDRPGVRLRVLYTGALTGVAGFVVYAVVPNYWAMLASSISLVAISGSLSPQLFAFGREVIERTSPTQATMGINVLRMMLSLSWALGAPVAAFVIGLIDFRGLFIATAVAHLVLVPAFGILRPGRSAAPAPASTPAPTIARGGPLPSTLTIVGTSAAFVLLQAIPATTVATMPLFVSVDLHRSVSQSGLILGLCALLEVPLMIVFGRLAARWPLRPLLLVGGGFGIAYGLVCSLATSVWLLGAAQLLEACFICTIGGLGISYFQELMPTALGRATTLFSNTGRVSGMFTGVIIGFAQVYGYRLGFVASLVMGILGTAVLAATPVRPALRHALKTA